MDTAQLQFNIIYTPDTVRYLTPFVSTLLRWSDCRYRLISNGCSDKEIDLLRAVAALDERLELLVMPEARMIPHGEMLDYLYAREESDYFCFMDSDVLATAAFMQEFKPLIEKSACFSSCLPLWHNAADITIPSWFQHMHGIHAYTEKGEVIACDYFVVYQRRQLEAAMQASKANMQVVGWNKLSAYAQDVLQRMGQQKADYDTGKILTMIMLDRGDTVTYRQSDALKHIGGFTEVGARKDALLFSRGTMDTIAAAVPGNLLMRWADAWYAWRSGAAGNSRGENRVLASRVRRRTATARYFYLLLVGLMDDQPLPAVPRLGDTQAELQLATVSDEIRTLIKEVRSQPGPWQDD